VRIASTFVRKLLFAVGALVGFLSGVDSDVPNKIGPLHELLRAVRTLVPRAVVNQQVLIVAVFSLQPHIKSRKVLS
jgi:hypothetical protein